MSNITIRKMIALMLFCGMLCLSQQVFSQQKSPTEAVAPLISEKTVVVAHVNLKVLDFEKLKQLTLLGVREYVRLQQFDEESTDDVLREAETLVDARLPMIESMYQAFIKETGLRDIYFLSYYDLMENVPGFVVIPQQHMTKAQRESLLEKFGGSGDFSDVIPFRQFLIFPCADSFAFDADELSEYFAELKPVRNPAFDEALAGTESAIFRAAAVVPENLPKILVDAGVPILPIPQFGAILHLLNEHTKWAHVVVDLDEPALRAAIRMSSEDAAVEARETLIDFIDMGVVSMTMQMELREETAEFAPLVGAYLRGMFKTLLPVVEGDKLVYKTSGENGTAAAVGVGGIAVALLLPAVQAAREAARRMQCSNNMKQLGLAIHTYHDARKSFPPAYTVDEDGMPLHGWRVLILPYIEQMALYEQIRLDEPWDSEYNSRFHDLIIPTFQCPSNRHVAPGAACCYSAVIGEKTVFPGSKGISLGTITDGTSNTILFVERRDPICWMDPTQELTLEDILEQGGPNKGREGLGSFHAGGINIGICDGSVQFLSETIDLETLKNLLIRDDGQVVRH